MNKMQIVGLCISLLMIATFACEKENDLSGQCTIPATVRDLTGLDGCGFVFELEDGSQLIPYFEGFWCGSTPPENVTQDPLFNFEYFEGKKVLIGYTLRNDIATTCMAGNVVKITCVKEISSPTY